jgi:hypothetical protein
MSALLIVAVLFLQLSVGWGRTYDCYMHCTAEANTTIYNTCTILTTYYGYNISECKAVFRQYSADTCNVHIYGFTVKLGNTADCEAEYPNGYPVQYYNGYAGPGSTCTPASTECDNFINVHFYPLVQYNGPVAGYLAARIFIIAAIVLGSIGFVYLAGRLLCHYVAAASCSCAGYGWHISFRGSKVAVDEKNDNIEKNDNDGSPLVEMIRSAA